MSEAPEAISFSSPITIIGAGAVRRKTLDLAQKLAPETVAVDAGADRLRSWGLTAAAVVGGHGFDRGSAILAPGWQPDPACDRTGQYRPREMPAPDRRSPVSGRRLSGQPFRPLFRRLWCLGVGGWMPSGPAGAGRDIAFAPPLRWRGDLPEGARLSILALRPVRITGAGGAALATGRACHRPGNRTWNRQHRHRPGSVDRIRSAGGDSGRGDGSTFRPLSVRSAEPSALRPGRQARIACGIRGEEQHGNSRGSCGRGRSAAGSGKHQP